MFSDKKYVLFNKDNNRVEVGHNNLPCVLSGELAHTTSCSPKIYSKNLSTLFHAWWYGLTFVEVNIVDLGKVGTPINHNYSYNWLMFKDGKHKGLMIRVWNETNTQYIPSNSSTYDGDMVMIKGIGEFKLSDFNEILWD